MVPNQNGEPKNNAPNLSTRSVKTIMYIYTKVKNLKLRHAFFIFPLKIVKDKE